MIGIGRHSAGRQVWRMRYRLLLALPIVALAILIARRLYAGGGMTMAIVGIFAVLITIEVVRALTTDDGF